MFAEVLYILHRSCYIYTDLSVTGMCLLKVMLERTEQSRLVTFMLYFACVFIVLGAFIFGLTLSQALIVDIKNHGAKADKSSYTC